MTVEAGNTVGTDGAPPQFIDWRYSQSGIFDPSYELTPRVNKYRGMYLYSV